MSPVPAPVGYSPRVAVPILTPPPPHLAGRCPFKPSGKAVPGGAGLLRLRGEAAARGEKRTRGDWAARAPRGPSPAVAGRHVTRRRLPARWTLEAKMAAELVEAKVSELCPPPHRRGPGRPGRAPSGVDRERHGLGPGPSRESRGGGAPGPPLLPPPPFFLPQGLPRPGLRARP